MAGRYAVRFTREMKKRAFTFLAFCFSVSRFIRIFVATNRLIYNKQLEQT